MNPRFSSTPMAATLIAATQIAATLMLTACTPAASPPTRRSLTSRPPQPPRPRLTVHPQALPIPEDYGVIRLNLARLWTSAIYRKYRARIASYISKMTSSYHDTIVILNRCGFHMERDLQTLTVAVDMQKGNSTKILVIRIRTNAHRLLRCVVKHAASQSTYKWFRFGPLKGLTRYKEGEVHSEVLALDSHRLVWMGRHSRDAVRAVLTKKRSSIASTQLYQTIRGAQPAEAMMLAVLPTMHEVLRKRRFSLLKTMMALGLTVDLPRGGLRLRGLVAFEKRESAAFLLRMMPMLSVALGKRAPALGPALKRLSLALDPSDPAVVRFDLGLTAAELNPVMALLEKTLSGLGAKPRSDR